MQIDPELIYAIAPSASAAIVAGIVEHQGMLATFGIGDDALAMFLGQCACETAGFTKLEESLFYTSTARLRQVWPARFRTDADAAPYVRNPKRLAILVYGGRLGNRPNTDDGWTYRGSGMPQLTGRANFTAAGYVDRADAVRRFPGAMETAADFWKRNNLQRFVAAKDIVGLTRAWQGGSAALADRRLYTDRAARAMIALPASKVRQRAERTDWLKIGSTGDLVLDAQKRLQVHGYYVGGLLDGRYGDATFDAVRQFQADRGLVADGVIGDATRTALAAAPEAEPAPAGTSAPKPINVAVGAAIGPCGAK